MSEDIIDELFRVIEDRRDDPSENSYTSSLIQGDSAPDEVLEKLGEEVTELVIASKNNDLDEVIHESADLIYHLLVLLGFHEVDIDELRGELRDRRK